MRRLLAILAVGILGMTLFATMASAATVDLQGRLNAQGSGLAHFSGGGMLEGKLAAGVIIVHGDPARLEVEATDAATGSKMASSTRAPAAKSASWGETLT